MKGNLQRKITCPGCEEDRTLPEELKESPKIVKDLKQQDQLTIICSEHQSNVTTMYCLKCEIPVCTDCKLNSHKDHHQIDLKQSKFETYSENVKQVFDEYSAHNMKSIIDKYAHNEFQINSAQFKSAINKVSRILNYLVDEDECVKIDLPTCLGEPQNDPQNLKIFTQLSVPKIAIGSHSVDFNQKDIQQLINESQAVLREEFKQALEAFEMTSNQKDKAFTDQTDKKMKDIQQVLDLYLQQFRQDINTDLKARFKDVVKDNDLNIKLQAVDSKYMKLNKQVQEINGNFVIELKLLNNQITELSTKVDSIKQSTQDEISALTNQLLEFKQASKSQEMNSVIVAVDAKPINKIQEETLIRYCQIIKIKLLMKRK
eukprot:403343016